MIKLNSIPFISDLFNLRGSATKSEQTFLDLGKVAIPTLLAGMFSLSDLSVKLFAFLPGSALIIQALVPFTLTLSCIKIIMQRKSEHIQSTGFVPTSLKIEYTYTFPEPERIAAKIFIIPISLLAVYYCMGILPNGIMGRTAISGYICQADNGKPINDGTVEVLDALGNTISKLPEQIDDTGFFFSDIKWWGSRPYFIVVTSKSCKAKQILINNSAREQGQCSYDNNLFPRKENYPVWVLTCEPEK